MMDRDSHDPPLGRDHSRPQSYAAMVSKKETTSKHHRRSVSDDAELHARPFTRDICYEEGSMKHYTTDASTHWAAQGSIKHRRLSRRTDDSNQSPRNEQRSSGPDSVSPSSKPTSTNVQSANTSGELRSSRIPQPSRSAVGKIKDFIISKTSMRDNSSSAQALERMEDEIKKLTRGIELREMKIVEQSDELKRYMSDLNERKKADNAIRAAWNKQHETIRRMTTKNKNLEVERDLAKDKVNELIRAQQLASFKHIDSAHWTPKEDSQVKADLDNLKRLMKNTTKEIAVAVMPDLSSIGDESRKSAFMANLREIMRWEHGEDPLDGMNSRKSAAVVLNALLAHSVYTRVIQPAFSFNDHPETGANTLGGIYHQAVQGE